MALTNREQQILTRSDGGASPRAIAQELGLTERYVRRTVEYYSFGGASDILLRAKMARASTALLDVITQAKAA